VYPNDARIPPDEEWFYELDDRARGALSRSDLEELLNRSGETASEVRVRQGVDGRWSPFQSHLSGAPATRAPGSTPEWGPESAESVGHRPPPRPVSPTALSGSRDLLRRQLDFGAAIGAWVLLNVIFLYWPQSYARERGYLQTLRAIDVQMHDLRAKPTSDAEWRQFAERTRATLAPVVSDLKKSASSSEPVRQQLLWSARDLIPGTLGPRTKERDQKERLLKQYLDGAQRQIESH
jgi:hypothetical protein